MNATDGRVLLFDDFRGVYIPRDFAQEVDHSYFRGYSWDDVAVLKRTGNIDYDESTPDEWANAQETYHEVWDKILRDAYMIDDQGRQWHLEQDGAVFLVCPELEREARREEINQELEKVSDAIQGAFEDPRYHVEPFGVGDSRVEIRDHSTNIKFILTIETDDERMD